MWGCRPTPRIPRYRPPGRPLPGPVGSVYQCGRLAARARLPPNAYLPERRAVIQQAPFTEAMPGRAFGTATNALHRRCSGRVRRGARRRARGGARAVVAPAPRPVGPPRPFGRGCPNPPRCARLPPGSLRPSLPGPWALGPGPPGAFSPLRPRRCPRPRGGSGGGPVGPLGGRARCGGGGLPPQGLPSVPVCGSTAAALGRGGGLAPFARAARLRAASPCSPRLRGGPGARLGPPRAAFVPPSLPPRGARAACGPRLLGALRPPRRRRTGVLAAPSGGKSIQKKVKAAAPTKRGKTAQGTLAARLGAGSVRSQLRY